MSLLSLIRSGLENPSDVPPWFRRKFSVYTWYFWERLGFHLVPDHHYYPIPNLKKLKNEDWQNPYSTNDVEMNEAAQISLVEEFERFEPEFKKLDEVGPGHHVDGAVYYSMVRELEPETIIEVGAGRSTNVALQASQENENEPEIIAVEPHPSDYLQSLSKSTAVLEFVNRKQSIFSQSGILRN